jgi:uncharacterized small protein (DUF1192 family)
MENVDPNKIIKRLGAQLSEVTIGNLILQEQIGILTEEVKRLEGLIPADTKTKEPGKK